MLNDHEARITKLEAEVKRLSDLVSKFTIGGVGGDVNITVESGVQGMSITTEEIGNDFAVTVKDVQGMTVATGEVGNDLAVSVNSAGGMTLETGEVGNDVSIRTDRGSIVVNTGTVGGKVG